MSTASSTAFSLWAVLSVLFLVFMTHHLWCYDRFKCLRWSAGRQPGAFKRVMTYSYLGAVPLLVVYSVGMMVIKYNEGYILTPDGQIIAVPINDYRSVNRHWVLPLQFVFSFAWALEIVTHLEELAFWLYLLHQNPNKEAWFSSWEYRFWYMGSILAIVGMPLTTLITRRDLETCDAYIFLVGASGSTLTTLTFLYVLWRFPQFIKHVKAEGADPTVVVRLATFYMLNQVRVVFRFLFTIPLLIIALDGIIGVTHPLNSNLFVTDLLQMAAGLGCFVSSMITLLIFFPRSIVREAGYKPKVSSTIPGPNSPKSPLATPLSHSPRFSHHEQMSAYVDANARNLPAHMARYVTPSAFRMSATAATTGYTTTDITGTGATTWEVEGSAYTRSGYSPRDSLYESPLYAYTAEDGDEGVAPGMQRRGSRVSRRASRASRRVGRPMDVHPEGDTDMDEGARNSVDEEDEERVPPYSHVHPQPLHLPPVEMTQTQAHLHHQHRLSQSRSNSHMRSAQAGSPHGLSLSHIAPPSSLPSTPPPLAPASSPPRSPSPTSKAKRRTWDWEERRIAPPPIQTNGIARTSMHFIADGSGATVVPLNVGLGLGVNPNSTMAGNGHARGASGGRGGRGSTLHPYVVNFTSPLDLVDLPPPHDEVPLAV